MKHSHPLNSLAQRARAHRSMAIAALQANSSLSSRLKRYNHHMRIARLAYSAAQGGES